GPLADSDMTWLAPVIVTDKLVPSIGNEELRNMWNRSFYDWATAVQDVDDEFTGRNNYDRLWGEMFGSDTESPFPSNAR
ncbi:hypothetical protein KIPB_017030, partial [Kipferlia bialata]